LTLNVSQTATVSVYAADARYVCDSYRFLLSTLESVEKLSGLTVREFQIEGALMLNAFADNARVILVQR